MTEKEVKQLLNGKLESLLPKEETLVGYEEVVEECNKRRIPMTMRTLQFYVTEGLIDKPILVKVEATDGRKRNKAFFDKESIFNQLACIYILKTRMRLSLGEVKTIIDNAQADLKDLTLLLENVYNEYSKKRPRDKRKRIIYRVVTDLVLSALKAGHPPKNMSISACEQAVTKLVDSGFAKMKQKLREKAINRYTEVLKKFKQKGKDLNNTIRTGLVFDQIIKEIDKLKIEDITK